MTRLKPIWTANRIGQGRRKGTWSWNRPAANSLRPQRASKGQGKESMVQKGVTANTTSSVSDQGEAETRPRTTGKRIDCSKLLRSSGI